MRIGAFAAFPENPQPRTGLGSPPVGVGQGSLIHTCPSGQTWDNSANGGYGGCVIIGQVVQIIPTIVPSSSINQTPDAVFGPISVAPCHSVLMTVFPIPSGSSVPSDPKTILEDLGFTVTGIGRSPTGGTIVRATLTRSQPYASNPADANVLVYSGESNGSFQSGEAITQGSNWGAVITALNDDPSSGSGSLTFKYGGPQAFDPTSTIIGYSSKAYATSVFIYEAVLVSPKGNGKLGVTNFTDLGDNGLPTWSSNEKKCVKVVLKGITPVLSCPPGTTLNPKTFGCDCPAGLTWSSNENRCVKVVLKGITLTPCPQGSQFDFHAGRCVCPGGQVNINGQCQCPVGQSLVSGQCTPNTAANAPPYQAPYQAPAPAPVPSTGMSTGTMIAIGVVALGAIGGAAWWYTQKRKHAALPAAPAAPASPASELLFQNPFLAQECSACGPPQDYEAAPNPRRRRRRRRVH